MATLKEEIQISNEEWADLEEKRKKREKKDKKIISRFCAENDSADIYSIIELLEKYDGMAGEDKKIISEFKSLYPEKISVQDIENFMDVQDIYSRVLEGGSGGNE